MEEKKKRGGGFAVIDKDLHREIASKGGKTAHQRGTAHEFTPEEAREAGSKGGLVTGADSRYMAEIGRKGGVKSGIARRRKAEQREASGDE